jgi:hypothetical protein
MRTDRAQHEVAAVQSGKRVTEACRNAEKLLEAERPGPEPPRERNQTAIFEDERLAAPVHCDLDGPRNGFRRKAL